MPIQATQQDTGQDTETWTGPQMPPSPCNPSSEVKVTQSCPTLCDPTDYTVHELLQARILEWVAFPFSRGSSWLRNWMGSPALQAYSSPTELSGKPWNPSKIDFIKESKDALSSTTDILGGAWFTKATKNFGSAAAHSSKANLTAGIKPRWWIFWRHNSADFSYSQSLLQVTHISMCGYAPYHMVSVLIIIFFSMKV